MNEEEKLSTAIHQVDNLVTLLDGNEYQTFIYSKLSTVRYEIERQLTNLEQSSKIKE
tara:strand:+ start:1316 stop:1486 length:171 start_codon:yes stop_codon:yes gene_type:complete